MSLIHNPILTGFHPDPSICRVGDDYYLATSTFEWFPGVRIHHSKDLAHWRVIGHALDRVSQLPMRGCQNSGGVWAPCLTHADGRFWLLFTNVHHHGPGIVMDTPNYVVTADHVEGPWSDPVFLNASGFDPSLFHDDDGRKYLVQMRMGEAFSGVRFDGIILQELDPHDMRLIGEVTRIWGGSPIGITEGPHLLKRDGWYYLITAEGGTAMRHAVSVCRSRHLRGPYEIHPENPILTSFGQADLVLQSSGHACFVDTPCGSWFAAHLCHRPLQRPNLPAMERERNKSAPLGRETCMQRLRWDDDGWPRLADGASLPALAVECPLPEHRWPERISGGFDPLDFQSLREPVDSSWCERSLDGSRLRLRGRDSLASCFDQSLIARRLGHFHASAQTRMVFRPENFKQSAGIIAYYDRFHYHYFRLTSGADGRMKLGVISSEDAQAGVFEVGVWDEEIADGIHLRMEIHQAELRFSWSFNGHEWHVVDKVFDATALGDWVSPHSNFTGTFWGVCCQDLSDRSAWAEFEGFHYQGEAS